MAKVTKRIHRKDAMSDHVHALPHGDMTNVQMYKPQCSQIRGWHTHLYEIDGCTAETGPAYDGVDHSHETSLGTTSGPMPVPHAGAIFKKNAS